jgi:hypothetical protein
VRGRFERGGRQRSIEVRFMEPHDTEAAGCGVVAQPAEGEFVGTGEYDQGVGRLVPVADEAGVRDGEAERRVYGLTDLPSR